MMQPLPRAQPQVGQENLRYGFFCGLVFTKAYLRSSIASMAYREPGEGVDMVQFKDWQAKQLKELNDEYTAKVNAGEIQGFSISPNNDGSFQITFVKRYLEN